MVNFADHVAMSRLFNIEPEMDKAEGSRLDEPSVIALFSRLQVGGLVRQGCVNLISFKVLREHLGGSAWRYARPYIWDHVNGCAGLHFPPDGWVERLNDTDFLVAWPAASPAPVQAASFRLLATAFRRVRMAWRPSDLVIRCVTEVRGQELGCVDLDPSSIARNDREILGLW